MEAVNFYKKIFVCKESLQRPKITLHNIAKLDSVTANQLTQAITKAEVFLALKQMDTHKALGPDGFHAVFFLSYWDIIGDEVWRVVHDAFHLSVVDSRITKTLIILILKIDPSTQVKKLWPISLCNVVLKLIMKVLVNCLRPHLPNIISPLQSSFIPGRGTRDNVIVVQ